MNYSKKKRGGNDIRAYFKMLGHLYYRQHGPRTKPWIAPRHCRVYWRKVQGTHH